MRVAFLTGALACGFAVAGLTTLVIWVITVLSGSAEPWSVAPFLVTGLALLAVVAAYAAETWAERATRARQRATGEPWAYRE